MHLLITGSGQVLGQTYSEDNAKRHVMVSKDKMFIVSKLSELGLLPVKVVSEMMSDYDVDTQMKLWNTLNKKSFPYWGKVSVEKVVRAVYAKDAAYTKDELLLVIPGATWISITTAFSMLKNKKYVSNNILPIKKIEGKYRRAA